MWTSDLFTVVDIPADMSLSPKSECSDSDSRSESPVPVDPFSPNSPRSIFKNYWTVPKNVDQDDEISQKLSALQMPLVNIEEDWSSHPVLADKETNASPEEVASEPPSDKPFTSNDSSSRSYRLAPAPDRSPTRRRQILPPPPSASIRPTPSCTRSCCRPWSSTSSLIKKPHGSCLRPSRYSFSGSTSVASLDSANTHQAEVLPNRSVLRKEVSFYAQVSVFEFTVPQEKRSDGWSNYFV